MTLIDIEQKKKQVGEEWRWTMICIYLLLLFVRVGSEYILFCYTFVSCWLRKPQRPPKQYKTTRTSFLVAHQNQMIRSHKMSSVLIVEYGDIKLEPN